MKKLYSSGHYGFIEYDVMGETEWHWSLRNPGGYIVSGDKCDLNIHYFFNKDEALQHRLKCLEWDIRNLQYNMKEWPNDHSFAAWKRDVEIYIKEAMKVRKLVENG